jgi:hypothetical protein
LAIALYLMEVAGYSATAAGLITLPSPIMSLLFARGVGGLAARFGPRIFLVTGPALAGLGLLLIRPSAHGFHILTDVLPGRILLAIGMVLAVTPLTAVNLSAVKSAQSGIAAAIQNATGRTSALIAVACVGLIAADRMTDASFTRRPRAAVGVESAISEYGLSATLLRRSPSACAPPAFRPESTPISPAVNCNLARHCKTRIP